MEQGPLYKTAGRKWKTLPTYLHSSYQRVRVTTIAFLTSGIARAQFGAHMGVTLFRLIIIIIFFFNSKIQMHRASGRRIIQMTRRRFLIRATSTPLHWAEPAQARPSNIHVTLGRRLLWIIVTSTNTRPYKRNEIVSWIISMVYRVCRVRDFVNVSRADCPIGDNRKMCSCNSRSSACLHLCP